MTFTRSRSGLANQVLFYRKRFIVYVEEKPGIDPGRSVDVPFWRSFFAQNYAPHLFEYKPLGGKFHVLQMADNIIANSVPNCLVALDRDYDEFFGEIVEDERVFYTHGYGVENDLFDLPTVKQIIRSILPGLDNADAIGEGVWQNVQATLNAERVALLSDQIASSRSAATLDRDKPQGVLVADSIPLRFRRSDIHSRMKLCKGKGKTRTAVRKLEADRRHVPAHLYFEIVYHSTLLTAIQYTSVKLSKDQFRSIALSLLLVSFELALTSTTMGHYAVMAKRDISKFSSLADAS